MKGSIFKMLEAYVEHEQGVGAFGDLLDDAGLSDRAYVAPGTYPSEEILALVAAASERYGATTDELMHAFGRFAFAPLARSVRTLIDGIDSAHEFLCGIETVMHTEIRRVDPTAQPARFQVTDLGPHELMLRYESGLGLFSFVEGVLAGVGDWFGTEITSEMVETDGTNATFRVLLAPALEKIEV